MSTEKTFNVLTTTNLPTLPERITIFLLCCVLGPSVFSTPELWRTFEITPTPSIYRFLTQKTSWLSVQGGSWSSQVPGPWTSGCSQKTQVHRHPLVYSVELFLEWIHSFALLRVVSPTLLGKNLDPCRCPREDSRTHETQGWAQRTTSPVRVLLAPSWSPSTSEQQSTDVIMKKANKQ